MKSSCICLAPLSKQPLERDTLHSQMRIEEIQRIIRQAIINVTYAVGMNNHMGSAMTSNLPAMQKVMQVLDQYQLYWHCPVATCGRDNRWMSLPFSR